MHPRLETVPLFNAAGKAMHVGRPNGGSAPPEFARMAASFSSIAAEGRHAKSTTLGSSGASPNGAKAMAAGGFARRGIAGTSSGRMYPTPNIMGKVCSVSFSRSGERAILCV
jgi:hypothetical protein